MHDAESSKDGQAGRDGQATACTNLQAGRHGCCFPHACVMVVVMVVVAVAGREAPQAPPPCSEYRYVIGLAAPADRLLYSRCSPHPAPPE